jgi:ABC-2 type transport system permease protein
MRPDERISRPPRLRSTLPLVGGQVVYQLRLLVRSPMSAFATLVVPIMVLLAVNLLYMGTRLGSRGGIRYAQFFTPAMIAFAVVSACYMSVISSTTLAREEGILKRVRSTPLPPWVYMAGRLVAAGLVAVVGAVIVSAVGAGVYGFEVVGRAIPTVLLTLAVAMFCFSSLGLAVTVLVPTIDSALPIAWGTVLPLCFISDVFEPIDGAPRWLGAIASAFPLRPFADALESAFNPVTGNVGIAWGALWMLAAWGVGGAMFALAAFRWTPASRSHDGRGSQKPGTFAAERIRDLLESRRGSPFTAEPDQPLDAGLQAGEPTSSATTRGQADAGTVDALK